MNTRVRICCLNTTFNFRILRPIFLLMLSLLRFPESNIPGDPLLTWEFHPLKSTLCLSQTLRNPESQYGAWPWLRFRSLEISVSRPTRKAKAIIIIIIIITIIIIIIIIIIIVRDGRPDRDGRTVARRSSRSTTYDPFNLTPNLPTKVIPTTIACLKLSGKFPMSMIIPPLKTKILHESNPLMSRISVRRLAVSYLYNHSAILSINNWKQYKHIRGAKYLIRRMDKPHHWNPWLFRASCSLRLPGTLLHGVRHRTWHLPDVAKEQTLAILYNTIQYYTMLYYTINYTKLYYTILYYTIL